MTETESLILEALKIELEYCETSYSQWILAFSVQEAEGVEWTHLVRVLIKTSGSPYIDGTDLRVIVDLTAATAAFYTEDIAPDPIFHGGTEEDGLSWLKIFNTPCYLQQDDPCKNAIITESNSQ